MDSAAGPKTSPLRGLKHLKRVALNCHKKSSALLLVLASIKPSRNPFGVPFWPQNQTCLFLAVTTFMPAGRLGIWANCKKPTPHKPHKKTLRGFVKRFRTWPFGTITTMGKTMVAQALRTNKSPKKPSCRFGNCPPTTHVGKGTGFITPFKWVPLASAYKSFCSTHVGSNHRPK